HKPAARAVIRAAEAMMWGSVVVYSGLGVVVAGLLAAIRPLPIWQLGSRLLGLRAMGAGLSVALAGTLLPVVESHADGTPTRLDEFAPAWQFHEVHTRRIPAPPDRVFDAIRRVRADEIALFGTLTWIRRGGCAAPRGVLNAVSDKPLLDVATESEFIWLALAPPRELVVGILVGPPAPALQCVYRRLGTCRVRTRVSATADLIKSPPPGFAVGTMNFLVTSDGPNASIVSTETRVSAGSDEARRRFAAYWRVIYPGSALIRRMWLRAIERRAAA